MSYNAREYPEQHVSEEGRLPDRRAEAVCRRVRRVRRRVEGEGRQTAEGRTGAGVRERSEVRPARADQPATNARRVGDNTDRWIGKTIEIYFNPDVPNPSGGEPGGLRLRIPETAPRAAAPTFRSELDEDGPKPPTPKKPRVKATEDEIPFRR